jgi:glycosyltransferase involved in cell wall biosynthesis
MQALQFADSVISPHPELTGILKDLKISKVSEIPNGIDIDSFSQKSGVARIIKEFNLKGMRVVSFIANLTDFKDPETFVRSAPYVLERNPDTIFLVVGDGYLKNKLVQIAKELNINSHFIFTGVRDDISSILAATDVFAALGTVENIWSTNILEAMASNVPCIVTLAGNTARYLTHRKNAYLVRTKDPAAVGAAITELINDRQLRENISSEAFEIIKERFDNCIVAKKTKDLYSKLIVSGI